MQVGRIPPVFGAFGRRAYGVDNPLIGQPFIYQYLTSLRSDSLPASADDLVYMKGMGWANYYPIGSETWDHGLPLAAADRWDTGVQVRWAAERVSVAMAVTQGTQCNPRVSDDNSGKQVLGRVEVRPVLGLVLGASAAQGDYVAESAIAALPPASREASHVQQAFGAGRGVLARALAPAHGGHPEPLVRPPRRGALRAIPARGLGRLRGGAAQDPARPVRRGALRPRRLQHLDRVPGRRVADAAWSPPGRPR